MHRDTRTGCSGYLDLLCVVAWLRSAPGSSWSVAIKTLLASSRGMMRSPYKVVAKFTLMELLVIENERHERVVSLGCFVCWTRTAQRAVYGVMQPQLQKSCARNSKLKEGHATSTVLASVIHVTRQPPGPQEGSVKFTKGYLGYLYTLQHGQGLTALGRSSWHLVNQ